ncbi:Tab2/Atab2 family RNA-binding protein [Leptolyngbya sp. FACHB-36]|uniref:Tab2 family RNA-binding protein n=1 Tax=Leptolyngbya sp. FACHB-36 TaxID=2692808 RepID=UPI00168037D1|nr:Tab2/Atab2 family RNA-binding protein [Leptolyngbya sp. FACHB-36]
MPTIWELDYYSRPILDDQNKKQWEVLICESPLEIDADPARLFRYAQYCPSTQVNSIWLKDAIEAAIAQAPNPPDKIRFFRQAMSNMILKACEDAGVPALLSRRTIALNRWLQQRFQDVYPTEPGYQPGANPSITFPVTPPQPLPSALLGDRWQFVSLDVSAFKDMREWAIDFGEVFPLGLVGLSPDTPIPGLLIISSRAKALAAWMSGLELAAVTLDAETPTRLLLETGLDDRWTLASLPKAELQEEARQFEQAKQRAIGVHFLAVQSNSEAEAFAGFWLLQGINLA